MSVKAISWVYDGLLALPKGPCDVLLALANCADDDGTCWPSQKYLASRTRYTVRTVQIHLKALEDAALVARSRRYTSRFGAAARLSDMYQLNVGAPYPPVEGQAVDPFHESFGDLAFAPWEPDDLGDTDDDPASQQVHEDSSPTGQPSSPDLTQADVCPSQQVHEDSSPTATVGEADSASRRSEQHLPHKEEPSLGTTRPGQASARMRAREAGSGRVGSGRGDARTNPETPVDAGEWALVRGCLPADWGGRLDAAMVVMLAPLLRERLAAGWRPAELRAVVGGSPLPPQVHSLGLLLAHRISEIPPECAPPRAGDAPPVELGEGPEPVVHEPWFWAFRRARAVGDPTATWQRRDEWRRRWEAAGGIPKEETSDECART